MVKFIRHVVFYNRINLILFIMYSTVLKLWILLFGLTGIEAILCQALQSVFNWSSNIIIWKHVYRSCVKMHQEIRFRHEFKLFLCNSNAKTHWFISKPMALSLASWWPWVNNFIFADEISANVTWWIGKDHPKGLFQFFFFKKNIYLFLQRREEREKLQCVVASHMSPTGDLAQNPSMCPDWELNGWPVGL